MIRIAMGTALVMALHQLGAAQDQKGDKLEGTWQFVSVQDGGRTRDEERTKNTKMTIIKNEMIIVNKKGDQTKEEKVTFKTDPSKSPKWIDITTGNGKVLHGIYEVKGDTLRLCFNEMAGGERSTAFESKANSPNDILMVLKREK